MVIWRALGGLQICKVKLQMFAKVHGLQCAFCDICKVLLRFSAIFAKSRARCVAAPIPSQPLHTAATCHIPRCHLLFVSNTEKSVNHIHTFRRSHTISACIIDR